MHACIDRTTQDVQIFSQCNNLLKYIELYNDKGRNARKAAGMERGREVGYDADDAKLVGTN